MKTFRNTVKRRLIFSILYTAVIFILLILGVFYIAAYEGETELISSFNLGMILGIWIVMLFYMKKYIAALKNEEKLKELYIAENDEREKFLQDKIGGSGINIVIAGLALGVMTAGYFNKTVFFTLIGAMLFSVFTKAGLKLYYRRKY